jgi:hypothetical protein
MTSLLNSHRNFRTCTSKRKIPRQSVLFIVAAPYTCRHQEDHKLTNIDDNIDTPVGDSRPTQLPVWHVRHSIGRHGSLFVSNLGQHLKEGEGTKRRTWQ